MSDDSSSGLITSISGGVSVAADQVSIGGDVVGRDKIVQGYTAAEVRTLLDQIVITFQPRPFDGRCPYLGLANYDEETADLFFGRERLAAELVARVRETRWVFITGPSGSGKSSLVRAGLMQSLKHNALPDSEHWLYESLKPGRDPLNELARVAASLTGTLNAGEDIRTKGRTDPTILHQWTEIALKDRRDRRAVILVDQFEEIFTQVTREAERAAFLNLLTHAATVEGGRAMFVFAMRSDFVSNCAAYPQLNDLLNQQFMQIGVMTPAELVSAIAQPALRVGLQVEPELVTQIIADMKGEPGALPLVQFALRDLFEAQQSKGGVQALTLRDYLERGGIHKALERHADSSFAQLSAPEQAIAQAIFSGLIQVGRGAEDTRRTALFDELVPTAVAPAQVEAVVGKLADARLIITDERDGRDIVTIAHEKLIDAWPWLRKLVNDNRDAIALQNQIAEDAGEWEKNQRDPSYLYIGARLANAREQLVAKKINLNGLAQAFVAAGVEAEQSNRLREAARLQKELDDARKLAESEKQRAEEQTRSATRLRQRAVYLIGALGIALVLGVIASVFAIQSNQSANANATLAAQNAAIANTAQAESQRAAVSERLARVRQLMAQSQSVFEAQPLLGVRLGLEALAIAPADEPVTREAAARIVIDQAATGRSLKVDRNVAKFGPTDKPSAYIMIYQSGTSEELRRMVDGARVLTFTKPIYDWTFSTGPEPRYLSVIYQSGEYEVRRTLDGSPVFSLTNQSLYSPSRFSPDRDARFYLDAGDFDTGVIQLRWSETGQPVFTPTYPLSGIAAYIPPTEPTLFVARYQTGPDELRRMADGSLIATLPFSLTKFQIAPGDAPQYVLLMDDDRESQQLSQLRRLSDGQLLEQLPGSIMRADFSPDAAAPYFVLGYWGKPPNELRHTIDGTLALTLTDELIYDVAFATVPGAPYFGVQYGSWAELRRTSDGSVAATLEQPFRSLYFSADPAAPYFVMSYGLPRRGELRRVSNTSLVQELPDVVQAANFSTDPKVPCFLVSYETAPAEIRRVSDGAVVDTTFVGAYPYFSRRAGSTFFILTDKPDSNKKNRGELRSTATGKLLERLPDIVDEVYLPDLPASQFLIRYATALPELRQTSDGTLVATLSARITGFEMGSCYKTTACQSGPYLWLPYVDGRSEVWAWTPVPHRLASLGTGVSGVTFEPQNRQLFIQYGDGRAYFLDLDWLNGLDDQAADMPLAQLMRLTCQALAAHHFDESTLRPYLNDQAPQACH